MDSKDTRLTLMEEVLLLGLKEHNNHIIFFYIFVSMIKDRLIYMQVSISRYGTNLT